MPYCGPPGSGTMHLADPESPFTPCGLDVDKDVGSFSTNVDVVTCPVCLRAEIAKLRKALRQATPYR